MPDPDLRHDIDALFDHLAEDPDHHPEDPKEWLFLLSSEDTDRLERIAHELEDGFNVGFVDNTVVDEAGEETEGPPTLGIVAEGIYDRSEIKTLAQRFQAIAETEGVTYDGVSCYDADEGDQWLDLDEALDRLGGFTDSGLDEGAPLVFTFAVATVSLDEAQEIAAAFAAAGFEQLEAMADEGEDGQPDPDAPVALLVHVQGANDGELLTRTYEQIESLAAETNAEFLGLQFFEQTNSDDEA